MSAITNRTLEVSLGITASYPEISLSLVDRDPGQPRQYFDDEDLRKLEKSIRKNTLLQAVTVRHHPTVSGRYMIIAGERRFRAMFLAGIKTAVFKLLEGPGLARSYILSSIENIQRVNLNPIEEAICYQKLHDEEHLSWEEISELLGSKDISVMLTKIKLLTLPAEIQEMVRGGKLPQVTALNLTQWKNETGDYLRMAHDLIAGRNPAQVHFRADTSRGERLVQAKLPKTADEYATRIVKLSGHVQSMPAVLEAFLQLPQDEQGRVLEAINPSVRGKLKVRFVALYRATQAMSEMLNAFDGMKSEEKSPTPNPEPTPLPPPEPPNPPKPHSEDTQSLEVSYEVLEAMLYSGGQYPRVNLSRQRLMNAIPNGVDPNELAQNAITAARMRWRASAKGREAEKKFIEFVSRIRFDFARDSVVIDEALKVIRRKDNSADPVSFS